MNTINDGNLVRTQVQLSSRQIVALKDLAARRGVSVSELVRIGMDSLVASDLAPDRAERKRRALAAVGGFRSGHRDVSRRHDAHLAEAMKK